MEDFIGMLYINRGPPSFFLITEIAGRHFELEEHNIHNNAQPDSITSPFMHSEKERQKEVLNSRVGIMAHKKFSVCFTYCAMRG